MWSAVQHCMMSRGSVAWGPHMDPLPSRECSCQRAAAEPQANARPRSDSLRSPQSLGLPPGEVRARGVLVPLEKTPMGLTKTPLLGFYWTNQTLAQESQRTPLMDPGNGPRSCLSPCALP